MKTIFILILTMSWVIPAPETSYAILPGSVDGQRSRPRPHHSQPAGASHLPRHARSTKANRPEQLPNRQQRSVPGNVMKVRAVGPTQVRGTGGSGPMLNEGGHNAWLARPSTPVRSLPSSLHNVRRRGSNPAVISGSVSPARRNNGMIDGTRMKRRP